VEKRYQGLIDLLDGRFQHKAAEDYLRSIDRNMRELNHSMKRFSTDLAGVIKEGLQEGMRPSTDRLLVAIENLEKQKSENIADTLAKVLQDFKASLNQGAGSEFAELGSTIGKLAVVMNDSAERSAAVSSRMDTLVQAIDSQVTKQQQMGDTSVAKLNESFGQLLTHIQESSRSQSESMKVMMEEMISRTGSATAGLISNVDSLTERNAKVASGFSSLAENFEKNIQRYNDTVASTQALIESTGDVASSTSKSLADVVALQTKIHSTYEHFTQQAAIVQQIQKDNVVSIDKYRVVFKEVESGLETVLRQIGDNLARYSDLTKTGLQGYLDDYDKSLSNATSKLSSTVGDLDEALENLSDHIEAIRKVGRTGTDG
jgi:ABC-type transporter Mla subunit MlaD